MPSLMDFSPRRLYCRAKPWESQDSGQIRKYLAELPHLAAERKLKTYLQPLIFITRPPFGKKDQSVLHVLLGSKQSLLSRLNQLYFAITTSTRNLTYGGRNQCLRFKWKHGEKAESNEKSRCQYVLVYFGYFSDVLGDHCDNYVRRYKVESQSSDRAPYFV